MAVIYTSILNNGGGLGNPINGTEVIGSGFGLGGTLIQDTEIDADGFEFDFFQTINGLDQRQHIGKIYPGIFNLDAVGQYEENIATGEFLFNGIVDYSPLFPGYEMFAIGIYNDTTTGTQATYEISKNYSSINFFNNNVASRANANILSAYLESQNSATGKSSKIEAKANGEADVLFKEHFEASSATVGNIAVQIRAVDPSSTQPDAASVYMNYSDAGSGTINGFLADVNGATILGVIHTDQVQTVAATPIPANYTKYFEVRDAAGVLQGRVPII